MITLKVDGRVVTVAVIRGSYAGEQISMLPRRWVHCFKSCSITDSCGFTVYSFSMLRIWVCVAVEDRA